VIRCIPYEEAYAKGFEDMRRRVPDTTKIAELLQWEPELTLDEILDDAIADARVEQRERKTIDLTREELAESLPRAV